MVVHSWGRGRVRGCLASGRVERDGRRRVRRWPEKGFIHERVLLFQAQRDWRTEPGRIIATGGTGKHKPAQKWRPLQAFSAVVATLPKIIQNDHPQRWPRPYRHEEITWRERGKKMFFATMGRGRRKSILSRENCENGHAKLDCSSLSLSFCGRKQKRISLRQVFISKVR